MKYPDPRLAVLVAKAEVPVSVAAEFRVGRNWAWEIPQDCAEGDADLPSGPTPWCLPGGDEAGVFVFSRISCEWPSWALGWHGSLELKVGIATYLQAPLGVFPVSFAGRVAIPPQQGVMAKVWGLTSPDCRDSTPAQRAESNLFTLKLHGRWGMELK
jgi:hypothetical protein